MRTLALGLLLIPTVAAAGPTRYETSISVQVSDPAPKLAIATMTEVLRVPRGAALDACWTQPGSVTMRVTFDGGKVTKVDGSAAGAANAACVIRVLRTITLPSREKVVTPMGLEPMFSA